MIGMADRGRRDPDQRFITLDLGDGALDNFDLIGRAYT